MAKITLNPISGSYASVPAINARLQQIEDAINTNLLWRTPVVGETNEMSQDLDLNNNRILNISGVLGPATGVTADSVGIVDTGGYYTGTDIEAMGQEIGAAQAAQDATVTTLTERARFQNIVTTYSSQAIGHIAVPSWATKGRINLLLQSSGTFTGDGAALWFTDGVLAPLAGTANGGAAVITPPTFSSIVDPNVLPLSQANGTDSLYMQIDVNQVDVTNDVVWQIAFNGSSQTASIFNGAGSASLSGRPAYVSIGAGLVTATGNLLWSGTVCTKWWQE